MIWHHWSATTMMLYYLLLSLHCWYAYYFLLYIGEEKSQPESGYYSNMQSDMSTGPRAD